jgi:hypothetical protein
MIPRSLRVRTTIESALDRLALLIEISRKKE